MSQPSVLKCVLCGKEYEPSTAPYTCDQCGLDGTLDVLYDYPRLKKSLHRASLEADSTPSLWRYGPVLPIIRDTSIPPLQVGWTPLYKARRLAEKGRNCPPTASKHQQLLDGLMQIDYNIIRENL